MDFGKQSGAGSGTSETLRWGVLGTARTAWKRTLPAIHRAGDEIIAIAGRNIQRLAEFQDEFGIESTYLWDDVDKLLAEPNIDAIYIPLPTGIHAYWTARALQAGKHVLCEKPVGVCLREVDDVLSIAARVGVAVEENFSYHLTPAFRHLERLRSAGKIDALKAISIRHSFPATIEHQLRYDRDLGGGSFLDLGCYGVDFVHRFLNEPIRVVAVEVTHPAGQQLSWGSGREHPIDTECKFRGQTASGVDVTINTSFVDVRQQSAELTMMNGTKITLPNAFLVEGTASELVSVQDDERSEQREHFDPFDCHREMLEYFGKKVHGTICQDRSWQDRWRTTAKVLAQVQTMVLEQMSRL